MKAQFRLIQDFFPMVEIVSDSTDLDDPFRGRVEIRFLNVDLERGGYKLDPQVHPNIAVGDMTPEQAIDWGKCLEAAGFLAARNGIFLVDIKEVYEKAWAWLDEWSKTNG